jgi:Ca2+-binding RTX toxin-like protein
VPTTSSSATTTRPFDPRPANAADRHEAADSFSTGDGNDSIWGDNRGGSNTADGAQADAANEPDDVVVSGGGADLIFGGAGNESVASGAGKDTVFGGAGDDTVLGGADDDSIRGESGADSLVGDAGNDTVSGDADADSLEGGFGDDSLSGNDGGDTIRGQEDNDNVAGNSGDDLLYGDAGSDSLHGNTGKDYMRGGTEADALFGDEESDRLFGDLGDDVIFGDLGSLTASAGAWTAAATADPATGDADSIDAGEGNDAIFGGAAGDDILGGTGSDLIFGDFGKTDLPLAAGATFTSTEVTSAAGGADSIDAGAGDDSAVGGQGGDTILGGDDNDDLIGGHNVAGGNDGADTVDGGAGHDAIAGDNAAIVRRSDNGSRNVRALAGSTLYNAAGLPNVTAAFQADPHGAPGRDITLFDHAAGTDAALFGADNLAGGAGHDSVFGQLGNDVIQGDGSTAIPVSATQSSVASLESDGDDYMEGGGGNDLMFGNLGQDDLIGGSSSLFGLNGAATRPDGADLIFGGAGIDLARNAPGDSSEGGHARDADVIVGDNGDIYRTVLVTTGATSYATFNYDDYAGTLRIIPRGVQLLDYSGDGNAANDAGAADLLHGEAGDDSIHGAAGDDFILGDGQDDELFGESGSDWISGGTGEDGILGDDGRMLTSRNGKSEPLYGIAATNQTSVEVKSLQLSATLNTTGKLLRGVDLEPFDIGGDDVMYGGLGDDSMHGGAGQDLMSGAEALSEFYKPAVRPSLVFDSAAGKFALFNTASPLARIANHPLNFEAFIGSPANKVNDGADALFGDGGNDWLVGGTQSDHLFGGYGNDVLNADDNLETAGGANSSPDAAPYADADLAFGGAGRDILLANVTADRLIDWVGNFNSYFVPFNPFGQATIIRQIGPGLAEFLYAVSRSDGADQTRVGTGLGSAARNGEPFGELGLVLQKDADWADQTGS